MSLHREVVIRLFDEAPGSGARLARAHRYDIPVVVDRVTARNIIAARVRKEFEPNRAMELAARHRTRERLSWIATHGDAGSPIYEGPVGPPALAPETPEAAVARALDAFKANRFLFFWGERQVLDVDEALDLDWSNEATFVQLVPLKGG